MSHQILDHTADLAVKVSARNREDLLAEVILVVREMAVGDSPVAESESRRIEISAREDGERFFQFVRELLFLYDDEGFIPRRLVDGERQVVTGEVFDARRHVPQHQAKALTRHRYRYDRTENGYEVEMVFDL